MIEFSCQILLDKFSCQIQWENLHKICKKMFEATVAQSMQAEHEGLWFQRDFRKGLFILAFFSESIFQIIVHRKRTQEDNSRLTVLKRWKSIFRADNAIRTWGQNPTENRTWASGIYSSQIIDHILCTGRLQDMSQKNFSHYMMLKRWKFAVQVSSR